MCFCVLNLGAKRVKLFCIELCEAPVYECPCIPPMGSVYLRSKTTIPRILFNGIKRHIQWAGDLGGTLHVGEAIPLLLPISTLTSLRRIHQKWYSIMIIYLL